METKPYFCPNCRSNRTKFMRITSYAEPLFKDAVTGEIREMKEPQPVEESEPTVSCVVCGFSGNEQRFVKQAEREPRHNSTVPSVYS